MNKKTGLLLLVLFVMMSCGTKKKAMPAGGVTAVESSKTILNEHNKLSHDFKTLAISGQVNYKDKKNSQKLSLEIRWQQDQKILISLRYFGITGAKALITPNKVSYYEKVNNTFFDGDFSLLSNWLGRDLNFEKVQNLLLGLSLEKLNPKHFDSKLQEGWLALTDNIQDEWLQTLWFDNQQYLLKKQSFKNNTTQDLFQIFYLSHHQSEQGIFPKEFQIKTNQPNNNVLIDIEFKQFNFNQDLTFPFQIPSGYKEITLP